MLWQLLNGSNIVTAQKIHARFSFFLVPGRNLWSLSGRFGALETKASLYLSIMTVLKQTKRTESSKKRTFKWPQFYSWGLLLGLFFWVWTSTYIALGFLTCNRMGYVRELLLQILFLLKHGWWLDIFMWAFILSHSCFLENGKNPTYITEFYHPCYFFL